MANFLRLTHGVALITFLTGCAGANPATEKEPPDDRYDSAIQITREAKIGTEDGDLIRWLKQHSESDDDLLHLDAIVRKLSDADFEMAAMKLVNLGLPALEPLRAARSSKNEEVAIHAKECMKKIEKESEVNLPLAIVRLLGQHRPSGAVEALLRYLPFTTDDQVEEETYYAVDGMALSEGKACLALLAALKDELPARRALAGCIVARIGDDSERRLARKLLRDSDPYVRLRTAQGFLAAKRKEAIPILINLIDESSLGIAWQAEELLHYAAGKESPEDVIGTGSAEMRTKCRKSWEEWWSKNETTIDLELPPKTYKCPFLVLIAGALSDAKVKSSLWLTGRDGKVRWSLTSKDTDRDAGLLVTRGQSRTTVVVLESEAHRIAERELDGTLIWEKPLRLVGPQTKSLCRMANGHTFVCTGTDWLQLDSDGKKVFPPSDPTSGRAPFTHAHKLSNGHVVGLAPLDAQFQELNIETDAELRTISLEDKPRLEKCMLESDPYDRLYFAYPNKDTIQIRRLLSDAETAWHCDIPSVRSFIVKRNGALLAITRDRADSICEVTSDCKTIWRLSLPGRARGITSCFNLLAFGFI
jgi:hypothetical protein